MGFDKPTFQTSNPYKSHDGTADITRTIYYGEVVNIDDPTEGMRIQVKILGLDNQTTNEDLPWCYPLMPKFFYVLPKVGEYVRILLEDKKYPIRSRFWEGPVISQLTKLEFDSIYTALSTTNMALTNPDPAPNTFPNAVGIYPGPEDVALLGRVNADIILKLNEVQIRAGQHDNDDVLTLNTLNPATIDMNFEQVQNSTDYYSNTVIQADKIAIISHTGDPQFKAAQLTPTDRVNIFENGHPMARADVLVEALEIIRTALINHIHGYANLPADITAAIINLQQIDFTAIMQKNIVIN